MACQWSLQKGDNSDVYLLIGGERAKNQHHEEYKHVITVEPGEHKDQIRLNFATSSEGRKLDRTKLDGCDDFNQNLLRCKSNTEFITVLAQTSTVSRKRKVVSTSREECSKRPRFLNVAELISQPQIVSPLPSNKLNCCAEDREIQNRRVGRFQIELNHLKCPPQNYLCRPISDWWVKRIKERLLTTLSPNVTVLPCLINPEQITNKKDFREENIDNYKCFTLGGNHFRTAAQQLLRQKEHGEIHHLKLVYVDLYVGLTAVQARRLGNQHNRQTETSRLCFIDEARQARRILYEMTARDMVTEESDRRLPEGYKKQCYLELSIHNTSNDPLTTTFHVAQYSTQYSKRCWDALESIAQRNSLKMLNGKQTNLKRAIFRNFQGISEADIFSFLKLVDDEAMSLNEASEKAKANKKMAVIKNTFMHLTYMSSWKAAKEQYPNDTNEEALKRFLPSFPTSLRSGNKSIPTDFISFCLNASNAKKNQWKVITTVYKNDRVCSNPEILKVVKKYQVQLTQDLLNMDKTNAPDHRTIK